MWDWRVRSGPLGVGGKAVEEEPETGHLVLFGYSQGKEVASRGEEPEAPRDWGEASVRGWAARVSLCCRPSLCCCAQAEVWGARWPGAPAVAAAAGQRSCASCQCCWWRWAERGPAARASASGEALGWGCGCSLYHPEGARWLLTQEVEGQQLENWGSARLACPPGSLKCPWCPRAGAWARRLGRELLWVAGLLFRSHKHHHSLWASRGWEHSGH